MTYNKTHQRWKEQGLCLMCGRDNHLPNKTRCLKCSERSKQLTKIRRDNRKQNNLCIVCENPSVKNKIRCRSCLDKNVKSTQSRKIIWKNNNLCSQCGQINYLSSFQSTSDYRPCENCYFRKVSRMRMGSNKYWEQLKSKLKAQNYKCAYTEEILILGVNDSLDHICPVSRFPEKYNDISNIEWTTRKINEMKRDRTREEFIDLVVTIYKSAGNHPAQSIT